MLDVIGSEAGASAIEGTPLLVGIATRGVAAGRGRKGLWETANP